MIEEGISTPPDSNLLSRHVRFVGEASFYWQLRPISSLFYSDTVIHITANHCQHLSMMLFLSPKSTFACFSHFQTIDVRLTYLSQ